MCDVHTLGKILYSTCMPLYVHTYVCISIKMGTKILTRMTWTAIWVCVKTQMHIKTWRKRFIAGTYCKAKNFRELTKSSQTNTGVHIHALSQGIPQMQHSLLLVFSDIEEHFF